MVGPKTTPNSRNIFKEGIVPNFIIRSSSTAVFLVLNENILCNMIPWHWLTEKYFRKLYIVSRNMLTLAFRHTYAVTYFELYANATILAMVVVCVQLYQSCRVQLYQSTLYQSCRTSLIWLRFCSWVSGGYKYLTFPQIMCLFNLFRPIRREKVLPCTCASFCTLYILKAIFI